MPARWHNSFLRYLLAIASVAAAMVLTRWLRGVGDAGISPLFFTAVLLSAWYGGTGPGFLATALSSLATAYLLLMPRGWTVAAIEEQIIRLAVFTVVSVLTSSLHGAIRRAGRESLRARQAAESANAAKSRFLAMVSHELRTPLSPVLIVAEMLEHDPALPTSMLADVRTIRRNVDLEIRLIEDLVDLTRISFGKLRLNSEQVDLHNPLRGAIEVVEADLHEKELSLTTRIAPEPALIVGDAVRLQQVFWNLLRNAVKFTPVGGKISIAMDRGADGWLIVEISDTGIGIAPERLTQIFEAFEQGDVMVQSRFGGLGLGLAICQALVQAHGGTIAASSEGKGRGATFAVELPAMRALGAPIDQTMPAREEVARAARP